MVGPDQTHVIYKAFHPVRARPRGELGLGAHFPPAAWIWNGRKGTEIDKKQHRPRNPYWCRGETPEPNGKDGTGDKV